MKKIKKLLTIILAMIMVGTMSMTAFAAESEEPSQSEQPVQVDRSYYDPSTFSFIGNRTESSRWYDGSYMAAEITASSYTSNLEVTVTAHITGYGSVTWTVPTDGQMHKKDWISLGTNSGRYVYFEYSCSDDPSATIYVHNTSYSW